MYERVYACIWVRTHASQFFFASHRGIRRGNQLSHSMLKITMFCLRELRCSCQRQDTTHALSLSFCIYLSVWRLVKVGHIALPSVFSLEIYNRFWIHFHAIFGFESSNRSSTNNTSPYLYLIPVCYCCFTNFFTYAAFKLDIWPIQLGYRECSSTFAWIYFWNWTLHI